jgi:membrane-bound metal-dependent hydrolase YbcI (DUF457 family)
MDPVSHAALGSSIGVLMTSRERIRGVMAAATTGAMLPDLDAVAMPFGWDRYLRVHEIGTHSLLGAMLCGLAAALLWRRDVRAPDWRRVVLAGGLGAVGHVCLDVLSSARIRVFWPALDQQISVPLVAMADPWLASLLAATLAALLLPARVRRRAVAALLVVAALFLGAKAVLARDAVRQYVEGGQPAADAYVIEARWASLNEWQVFDRRGSERRQWRIGPRGLELVAAWNADSRSTAAAASLELGTVRNFVPVHELAFPIVVQRPDGLTVLWSDPRFCWRPPPASRGRPPAALAPAGDLACAVWAGGELDARGHARRQIVHLFGFTPPRLVE